MLCLRHWNMLPWNVWGFLDVRHSSLDRHVVSVPLYPVVFDSPVVPLRTSCAEWYINPPIHNTVSSKCHPMFPPGVTVSPLPFWSERGVEVQMRRRSMSRLTCVRRTLGSGLVTCPRWFFSFLLPLLPFVWLCESLR